MQRGWHFQWKQNNTLALLDCSHRKSQPNDMLIHVTGIPTASWKKYNPTGIQKQLAEGYLKWQPCCCWNDVTIITGVVHRVVANQADLTTSATCRTCILGLLWVCSALSCCIRQHCSRQIIIINSDTTAQLRNPWLTHIPSSCYKFKAKPREESIKSTGSPSPLINFWLEALWYFRGGY